MEDNQLPGGNLGQIVIWLTIVEKLLWIIIWLGLIFVSIWVFAKALPIIEGINEYLLWGERV